MPTLPQAPSLPTMVPQQATTAIRPRSPTSRRRAFPALARDVWACVSSGRSLLRGFALDRRTTGIEARFDEIRAEGSWGTRHGNHRMIGAPGEASQITSNSPENILDSYLDSGLSSTTPIHKNSARGPSPSGEG